WIVAGLVGSAHLPGSHVPPLLPLDQFIFLHQFAQAAQRFAAVTDFVFFFGGKLGGGFAQLVDEEKRIIAESVFAALFPQDSAFDLVAGGEEDVAVGSGQGERADESAGALLVGDVVELVDEKVV